MKKSSLSPFLLFPYEVGKLGTLVSRIIDYETKNEIKRSGKVGEIGNGTFAGSGKPISAALMLTHLQKENGLIKKGTLKPEQLNEALGVKSGGQAVPTWFLDQLARGLATARNRFYEITDSFPIISSDAQGYLYVHPKVTKKDIPVRIKINNKATKSLLIYTPYVTSEPSPDYGGNALFWAVWTGFGF